MSSNNSNYIEEDVLLAFSVEPSHDRETLVRYLTEYPQFTEALIECSIELKFAEATDAEPEIKVSDDCAEKAWLQFQDLLSKSDKFTVVNPFGALNQAAFKALATQLNVNSLFLARLRDRAIDITTIPRRFIDMLSAALGTATNDVAAYLNGPSLIASNQSFRSSVKPSAAAKITFDKAIADSQLTQAQQAALRALMN